MELCEFPVFTAQLGGGGKNGGRYFYAWRKYTLGCNQKSSKKATKLAITRFLLKFKVFRRLKKFISSYIHAISFAVVSLPLPQMALQNTPQKQTARGDFLQHEAPAQGVRL